MVLEKAIKRAKSEVVEKVAMNVRFDPELKDRLHELAKENGVSMNTLITSILDVAVTESPTHTVDKLEQLQLRESELMTMLQDGVDEYVSNGINFYTGDELSKVQDNIKMLQRGL